MQTIWKDHRKFNQHGFLFLKLSGGTFIKSAHAAIEKVAKMWVQTIFDRVIIIFVHYKSKTNSQKFLNKFNKYVLFYGY